MSCCTNYLGKFPHNEDISTDIIANASGTFIFQFEYINAGFEIEIEGVIDEELIIPLGQLNENFSYRFKIIDPNGDFYERDLCTDFSLKIFVNLTPCENDCDTSVYL